MQKCGPFDCHRPVQCLYWCKISIISSIFHVTTAFVQYIQCRTNKNINILLNSMHLQLQSRWLYTDARVSTDSTRGSLERVWHVRRSSESRQAAVTFALLFAFRWGHTHRTSLIPVHSCLHFRLMFGWSLAYTQNSPIRGDRKFAPNYTDA